MFSRSLPLLMPLAALITVAAAARSVETLYELPEPLVPGCQNLHAKPAKPIKLTGKIFVTYLPNGKRYTKLKEPTPPDFFEVGVLDFDKPGSGITRLTDDQTHDAEVRVSPDGKKIIWSTRPVLDYFDGENSILIANADMSERRVLAHGIGRYMGIPSFFKPSGSKIMFSTQGEGDNYAKLMTLDLNTLATTELKAKFKGGISDPQMSQDGKKIAFKSEDPRDEDAMHIYLMNADGSGVKKLTHGDYRDEDPAFSPNGKIIAFERMYGVVEHKGKHKDDYYFQEGIVTLNLATGRETMITEPDPCGKNELWLPTWSPDGEYLMFTRGLHLEDGDFTHDLWVSRKDGSDLQRVPGSEGIMFFDWVK